MTAKSPTQPAHLIAPCAHCGEPARLDPSNPWRPFCSERCKMLDLGQWFSGTYAIRDDDDAGEHVHEPFEQPGLRRP